MEVLEPEGSEQVDYDDGNIFDVFGWWRAYNSTYNSRLVLKVPLKYSFHHKNHLQFLY